mgnify:CR=1 FL=1
MYRTKGKGDRKYAAGGQLIKDGNTTFKYDDEGNQIEKKAKSGAIQYEWFGNGMLQSVTKPNGKKITFEYDALGRRTAKIVSVRAQSRTSMLTRFVWDGYVPLHEWKYPLNDRPEWWLMSGVCFLRIKKSLLTI